MSGNKSETTWQVYSIGPQGNETILGSGLTRDQAEKKVAKRRERLARHLPGAHSDIFLREETVNNRLTAVQKALPSLQAKATDPSYDTHCPWWLDPASGRPVEGPAEGTSWAAAAVRARLQRNLPYTTVFIKSGPAVKVEITKGSGEGLSTAHGAPASNLLRTMRNYLVRKMSWMRSSGV